MLISCEVYAMLNEYNLINMLSWRILTKKNINNVNNNFLSIRTRYQILSKYSVLLYILTVF